MSLLTAPTTFAYCTHNLPSTPSSSAPGTAFTAGASDTDGTAVTLLSAVGHDVHLVRLRIMGVAVSAADGNAVGDLLIDPAGGTSWTAIANDLACGMSILASTGTGPGAATSYTFPLYIPSGSSIGWRAKTVRATDITTGYAIIEVLGEPSRPDVWWCGQGVETLGVSDSKGTGITPGNTGAAGSWTSVGTTTSKNIRSIQLGINGSDSNAISATYRFDIGTGSNILPGSLPRSVVMVNSEQAYHENTYPISCNIASGTQMQVRATCSTTAEVMYVGLYGVY